MEVVEEEPDFPAGREEEEGLPEVPEELSGARITRAFRRI